MEKKCVIVAVIPDLNNSYSSWIPKGLENICYNIIDLQSLRFKDDQISLITAYDAYNNEVNFENSPLSVKVLLNFTMREVPECKNCLIYGNPKFNLWFENDVVKKFIKYEIESEGSVVFFLKDDSVVVPNALRKALKDKIKSLSTLKNYLGSEVKILSRIDIESMAPDEHYFVTEKSDIDSIVHKGEFFVVEEKYKNKGIVGRTLGTFQVLRMNAFKGTNEIFLGPMYILSLNSSLGTTDNGNVRLFSATKDQLNQIKQFINSYLNKLDELNPYNSSDCKKMYFSFDILIDELDNLHLYDVHRPFSLSTHLKSGDEINVTDYAIEAFQNQFVEEFTDTQWEGKNVLVIGYGSYSKKSLFTWINQVKANLILVDKENPNFNFEYLFIQTDLLDMEKSKNVILKALESVHIESVVSLYEDYIPLKHLIQEELIIRKQHKTNYSASFENALLNKDKVSVYNRITNIVDNTSDFNSYCFAPRCTILNTLDEVKEFQGSYPLIIKYSTASSAFGTRKIQNKEELVHAYINLKETLAQKSSNDGIGVGFNYKIFVSEYFEGSEHDIDIILSNGKVLFSVIADNKEVNPINPRETGVLMPTRYYNSLESKQIERHISDQLIKIGLPHGVFNVEFIETPLGIKIIDVNPRPGGYYINYYIKNLFGIDTFKCEVILNSSMPLIIFPRSTNRRLEGTAIYDKKESVESDFVVELAEELVEHNEIDMIACATNVVYM